MNWIAIQIKFDLVIESQWKIKIVIVVKLCFFFKLVWLGIHPLPFVKVCLFFFSYYWEKETFLHGLSSYAHHLTVRLSFTYM